MNDNARHAHLRMLARIGRTTSYSQEKIAEMLARHGTPLEVKQAIDEAFAIPEDVFNQQIDALAKAIQSSQDLIDSTALKGKSIDARGFDEADRITEAIAHGTLGLNDPKDAT